MFSFTACIITQLLCEDGVPGHAILSTTWDTHLPQAEFMTYHFLSSIFLQSVPVCAAMSFFRSPTVSSGLHLTPRWYTSINMERRAVVWRRARRPLRPKWSFAMTCTRDSKNTGPVYWWISERTSMRAMYWWWRAWSSSKTGRLRSWDEPSETTAGACRNAARASLWISSWSPSTVPLIKDTYQPLPSLGKYPSRTPMVR